MATGRANHLTKQIGEYLVAAELGRLGLIAATFSGNVPDYDIVATDASGATVLVQVKAVRGSTWQFDIRRFAKMTLEGKKQVIEDPLSLQSNIVCVLVALSEYGRDHFYVLRLGELQELLISGHQQYLDRHGGVRPKKFDSFHVGIRESDLARFKDRWAQEFSAIGR